MPHVPLLLRGLALSPSVASSIELSVEVLYSAGRWPRMKLPATVAYALADDSLSPLRDAPAPRKLAAPRSKALLRLLLVADRGRPRCSIGEAERVGVAAFAELHCFQMVISHGPLLVPDELTLRQCARATDRRLSSG